MEKNIYKIGKELFITSDEEIKKEDWVFVEGQLAPQKARGVLPNGDIECANGIDYVGRKTKKIILTTDQDLIADGVQPIDDEFLEWFVKNPSCNNIEVDLLPYDGTKSIDKYWFGEYKIIIPQEESNPFELPKVLPDDVFYQSLEEPKQETLENEAELFAKKRHELDPVYSMGLYYGYIEGAKRQSEKTFSEEEVLQLLLRLQQTESYDNLHDWFEQFKKK